MILWLSKPSMAIVMFLNVVVTLLLGGWCSKMRGSYKKMQHNQKPKIKLSDEHIQRLNDAGFKWCLQGRRIVPTRTYEVIECGMKRPMAPASLKMI